jgi:hypothetical protein
MSGKYQEEVEAIIKEASYCEDFAMPEEKRLVMISPRFPIYSTSSGMPFCRVFNLLKVFLKNGFKVYSLYLQEYDQVKVKSYQEEMARCGDIQFVHMPREVSSCVEYLSSLDADYIWLTDIWEEQQYAFFEELARGIKEECAGPLVFGAMNVKAKSNLRTFFESRNYKDLHRAQRFYDMEKKIFSHADYVTVFTEKEKLAVRSLFPGASATVIPHMYRLTEVGRGFEERENICFIGNMEHFHDLDAVKYFVDEIFPFILEKYPDIEFHVIGSDPQKFSGNWASDNIKIYGDVEDIYETLSHYKLFVCPMNFAVGRKSEIGFVMNAGIPLVATPTGAEGFDITDGQEGYLEKEAYQFANKCIRCLESRERWEYFSAMTRKSLAQHNSINIVSSLLKAFFHEKVMKGFPQRKYSLPMEVERTLDEESPEAYNAYGDGAYEKGDYECAEVWYKKALKENEYPSYAEAAVARGRDGEALELLKRSVVTIGQAYRGRAAVAEKIGDSRDAKEYFELAVKINPAFE